MLTQELHQVYVLTAKGEHKAVGPRVSAKGFAEQLASSIRMAISMGRIHGWSDPTVVTLIEAGS